MTLHSTVLISGFASFCFFYYSKGGSLRDFNLRWTDFSLSLSLLFSCLLMNNNLNNSCYQNRWNLFDFSLAIYYCQN